MASFGQAIKLLSMLYSKDDDQAWTTAREMHDLGYELDLIQEHDVGFFDGHTMIVPATAGNVPCWAISNRGYNRAVVAQFICSGKVPTFPTPAAAAVWLSVERSNDPAPVIPSPAPVMPSPQVSTARLQAPTMPNMPQAQNPWAGIGQPAVLPQPYGQGEYDRLIRLAKGPFV